MRVRYWLQLWGIALVFGMLSCGGTGSKSSSSTNSGAASGAQPTSSSPATASTICNCTPDEPTSVDYRHAAKHVGLPSSSGQEITVAEILGWVVGNDPASDAPRGGIENQMFHISTAYVQFIWLVPNDCDIHMEISDTPDKNAPRVIVETPIDAEYCPTREAEVTGFSRYGAQVSTGGFETAQGIPVEVLGLAFRDYDHQRGTTHVAGPWEIHPAVVTVK